LKDRLGSQAVIKLWRKALDASVMPVSELVVDPENEAGLSYGELLGCVEWACFKRPHVESVLVCLSEEHQWEFEEHSEEHPWGHQVQSKLRRLSLVALASLQAREVSSYFGGAWSSDSINCEHCPLRPLAFLPLP
jgi:hypothetical protein